MRILITGVTGQIGGALASRLSGASTIIAADRSMLDLAQPHAIAAALGYLSPDLIINPAAYTAVDSAEHEPALAMRVNGEAPGAIARWAAARGVPLIHFSTDYVFSGSGDRAWREDDEAQPLSAYGRSKLAGEEALRAAGGSFLIIRTSWLYAATGKNFLRTIARRARHAGELRVVADQIGAPTSAAMVAECVDRMLAPGLESFRARCAKACGVIHLCAAGRTSWHGFAAAIVAGLRARGLKLAVERIAAIASHDFPQRAKRPHNSQLDLTRLQRVFGITTPQWDVALAPELNLVVQQLASDRRVIDKEAS
jgi:dTDP-4-dehydrorhamnose reductase